MANVRISEEKIVRVKRLTCENPIQLVWFNSLGARENWVFSGRFGQSLRVFGATNYKQYEPSIKYGTDLQRGPSNGADRMLKKEAQKSLLLTASNIDDNDLRTIGGLLQSVEVVMLINFDQWEVDGPEWVNVRIAPGSWDLGDTDRGLYELQFEIILQDRKLLWQ